MNSFNAILLLDYLALRKKQQETHLQILKNEAISAERSYNLLFSYISHNQRTTNSIDEMTGILSSLSSLSSLSNLSTPISTRRSTPALASQLRSTMNRSTNTTPNSSSSNYFRLHPTPRENSNTWRIPTRPRRRLYREQPGVGPFPQTINFTRTTFDNTPIPPTPAEIEITTLSCKYQDVSTNQLICPIARTNFESNDDILQIIYCNHIFKKEPLLIWFETKQTCPICRHNITQNAVAPPITPPV